MRSDEAPRSLAPRFRLATLLALVAVIALGLAAWKAAWTPGRIWRSGIHGGDPARRAEAWGAARSGRIGGLSPRATAEEVAATIEDSDDEAVSTAITAYLLIEPDPDLAARRLARRLKDDGQASVRRVAASTLRLVVRPDGSGREAVVPNLIAALDDTAASVRRAAALSLGEIGYRVGHADPYRPDEALRRHLADASEPVRFAVALALARGGGGEEAVPLLEAFLQDHKNDDCRGRDCRTAFEALMVLAPRSDRAASALIAGVYREGKGRSSEVLATLAGVVANDYHARARIKARAKVAFESPSAALQLSAGLALVRVDEGRDAVPGLARALDLGSRDARAHAEFTLRQLASTEPDAIRSVMDEPSLSKGTREALRSLIP